MMKHLRNILMLVLWCGSYRTSGVVRKFPKGMMIGAATSSYQIEGGWNEDGKGESLWDYWIHKNPSKVVDDSNADIAADSYHKVERDVEMVRELGLDFYRFSISWVRVLPDGFSNNVNQAGIDYYNKLINELLKYNIKPVVTLYHWELPQKFQTLGGWTNSESTDWFGDFARVIFKNFGDRVKYWVTINEPFFICYARNGAAIRVPQLNYTGIDDYLCAKNVLLAHARAYHIYDEYFRKTQGGVIGISLDSPWAEPESDSDADLAISHKYLTFHLGLYANPIFSKEGDFPKLVKDIVNANSAKQGYSRSRLPKLTKSQIKYMKGTSDYFGLNYYTTFMVNNSLTTNDMNINQYFREEWIREQIPSMRVVPWGLYKLLRWIRKEYNNPPVYITENGFTVEKDHDERIPYFKDYLSAMLDAIDDGSNVQMYTVWSLIDTFEWLYGYTLKFGLYHVDFESKEKTRTPRRAAFLFKHITSTRTLDMDYEPPYNSNITLVEYKN